MASNTVPATWNMKPTHENEISPKLAIATPRTMTKMLTMVEVVGSASPQSHEKKSTTTGDALLSIWIKGTESHR